MSDFIEKSLKNPRTDTLYALDIDSTLVSTYARNQAIIEKFCHDYRHSHPMECEQLSQVKCQLGDYGYHSSLSRLGLSLEHLKCGPELAAYWRQHFFSHQYLHLDRPTTGAVQWVKSLEKSGANFIYLTARHHKTMWSGTLKSLYDLGFPIDEKILFLKEDLQQKDAIYKSVLLQKLIKERSLNHCIVIDNEPVVLNQIQRDLPNVHLCWYDLTHSGKMSPPDEAYVIKTFLFAAQ